MKTQLLIGTLAMLVSISTLNAQPRPDRPGGLRPPPRGEQTDAADQRPPRPHAPPVIATLDADHDGVISSDEIKNAPTALKELDKNGDGQITVDELRPHRPDSGDDEDGAGNGPRPHGPPPEVEN